VIKSRKRKDEIPVCYNCSYDMNEDVGKFPVKARQGRFRIVMRRVTDTIYSCPKCGSTQATPLFKPKVTPYKIAKAHRKRQRERVELLRKIHQKHYISPSPFWVNKNNTGVIKAVT